MSVGIAVAQDGADHLLNAKTRRHSHASITICSEIFKRYVSALDCLETRRISGRLRYGYIVRPAIDPCTPSVIGIEHKEVPYDYALMSQWPYCCVSEFVTQVTSVMIKSRYGASADCDVFDSYAMRP